MRQTFEHAEQPLPRPLQLLRDATHLRQFLGLLAALRGIERLPGLRTFTQLAVELFEVLLKVGLLLIEAVLQ
ncbi:hypothetical protein D3C80_2008450 [compost metagenome]